MDPLKFLQGDRVSVITACFLLFFRSAFGRFKNAADLYRQAVKDYPARQESVYGLVQALLHDHRSWTSPRGRIISPASLMNLSPAT